MRRPTGRVPEWTKGTGCKPVGFGLRWFESSRAHSNKAPSGAFFLAQVRGENPSGSGHGATTDDCPMNIRWIFFDWGGTLAQVVSQSDRLTAGAREAARILGPDNPDCAASLIERILGLEALAAADPELREGNVHACLREWAATVGSASPDQLTRAADALGSAWVGSLEALPGVHDALTTLRERGYRMGLVSNCLVPAVYCHRELARLGLADFLDFVVLSSEVGYRKPSPVIYAKAIERATAGGEPPKPSDILFVGDSPAFDVIKPAELGMHTALVRCYRGIWPAADYERARPDLRIDAVAELPARLADVRIGR